MRRAEPMTRAQAAALLGVAVDADDAAVRSAWRMWARMAHPDLGGDPAHFARLDAARRVLLATRHEPAVAPVPASAPGPAPRLPLPSVLHRPAHPAALVAAAVATIALALLPALLADPDDLGAIASEALPASVAAVAWAAWLARAMLGAEADRGHRMAMLVAAWLPIAVAQQALAAIAGVSLVSVLPVVALPLVATVGVMNAGAGLWRPIAAPRRETTT